MTATQPITQQACNCWAWPTNYPVSQPSGYTYTLPTSGGGSGGTVQQNAAMFGYGNPYTPNPPSQPAYGYGLAAFNAPQVRVTPNLADFRLVQGGHTGVVQVCMGDNSVRGVTARVSQATWQNAITPADGASLGSDWQE